MEVCSVERGGSEALLEPPARLVVQQAGEVRPGRGTWRLDDDGGIGAWRSAGRYTSGSCERSELRFRIQVLANTRRHQRTVRSRRSSSTCVVGRLKVKCRSCSVDIHGRWCFLDGRGVLSRRRRMPVSAGHSSRQRAPCRSAASPGLVRSTIPTAADPVLLSARYLRRPPCHLVFGSACDGLEGHRPDRRPARFRLRPARTSPRPGSVVCRCRLQRLIGTGGLVAVSPVMYFS